MFGDGVIEWQVTPGLNLYRRETSDLISFLFHAESYNFLAGENQIYLPPYGKYLILIFILFKYPTLSFIFHDIHNPIYKLRADQH